MSDIAVHKQATETQPTFANERTWDPWRSVRALLSWDPFREIAPFSAIHEGAFSVSPAFDVKETRETYEFKADVPGIQEKDLEVSMTANRLTVSGKREAEKEDRGERHYTYERTYGSFSRSFTLPDGADAESVHATLEKGVLSVIVPKKPDVVAKRVTVKAEGQGVKH